MMIKNILGKHSSLFFILWGFILGVAINIHFQAVELSTLPLFYFIYAKKKRFIFPFFLGIFISMLPILFFELNNHWFNTKHIVDYFLIGQYRIWTSNRWLTFVGKFWPEFWSYTLGFPLVLAYLAIISSVIYFGYYLLKKKLNVPIIIILLSFILEVIILRYYRGEKFFGYLQFFHPYLFIFTGYIIYFLFKRLPLIYFLMLIIFYIYSALPNTLIYTAPDKLNLDTTNRLAKLKKIYPNSKFSTYLCNIYDNDRIQALTLIIYMHKLFDNNGVKVAVFNSTCNFESGAIISNDLVNISNLSEAKLKAQGFSLISPSTIYNDTARWWFREQP